MENPNSNSRKLIVGGFSRLRQLVPYYIPVSASTFWRMVKNAQFPAPVKLTGRITAWSNDDVQNWLDAKANQSATHATHKKD